MPSLTPREARIAARVAAAAEAAAAREAKRASRLSGPKLIADPAAAKQMTRNSGGIAKAKTVNPVYNTY